MNDPKTCFHCHSPLTGTPTPHAIGTIDEHGTTALLYLCSKACRDAKHLESVSTRQCIECGTSIPGEFNKAKSDRSQHCSRACKNATDKRRARVWKSAARSTTPGSLEDVAAMRSDLTKLQTEIDQGLLPSKPPASARALLARYGHELDARDEKLAADAPAKRIRDHWADADRRGAEDSKARRQELNDWLKQAGGSPVEDLPPGLDYTYAIPVHPR